VQFGYMNPQTMSGVFYPSPNVTSTALTDFQMFVGLQPTGMLGLRWAGYVVCMGRLKARVELTWNICRKR
jgi:hypothetical protein